MVRPDDNAQLPLPFGGRASPCCADEWLRLDPGGMLMEGWLWPTDHGPNSVTTSS